LFFSTSQPNLVCGIPTPKGLSHGCGAVVGYEVLGVGVEVIFPSCALNGFVYSVSTCLYAGLCMYACLLITRERSMALSPNF